MSWKAKTEEKRRLEKLHRETFSKYGVGCYHNDKRGGILTRWYPYSTNHGNIKKWWKRHSNRKVRMDETDILERGQHKKKFDLWWTLF